MAISIGQILVELQANTAVFRTEMDRAIKKMDEFTGATEFLKKTLQIATGVSLANITDQLAHAAVEAIHLAHAAELAEYAFEQMARTAGIAGDELSKALKDASGNTARMTSTLQTAARGLQQGLQPEQLVKIMEIARSQSVLTGETVTEAFNSIGTAIANQQVRMLRSYGIVIDLDKALKDFAQAQGKDVQFLTEAGRAQAIYARVLEVMRDKQIDVTDAVVKHKEQLEILEATGRRVWVTVGKAALSALYAIGNALEEGYKKLDAFTQYIMQNFGGPGFSALPPAPATAAPGGVTLGGLEAGAGLPGFDEKKIARQAELAASADRLTRALGGTQVAEAALALTTANAVEVAQEHIKYLQIRTQAELDANAVSLRNAESEDERNKLRQSRAQIQLRATADMIGLQVKLRDATLAQAEAEAQLIKGFEGEAAVAERDTQILNERTKAMQDSLKATRDLLLLLQTEGAAEPEGGPGPAPAAMLNAMKAARGQPMADFLRTEREIADVAEVLGYNFDKTTATINNLRRALEELAKVDPGSIRIKELREELEKTQAISNVITDVFSGLSGALSGMLNGLLQGTQTLQQAFANMARNIAASIITNVINRGLKVAQDALIEFALNASKLGLLGALQGAFGLTGGAASAAAPATAVSFSSIPYLQHGGIVTSPTLAVVGEAGPEAVVPLSGSGPMVVVNITPPSGYIGEERERRGPSGETIKDIVFRALRQGVGTGEIDAIFSPYGLRRQPMSR